MAIIVFKSILFIAGLGNIDGTLVSPNGNSNLQINTFHRWSWKY